MDNILLSIFFSFITTFFAIPVIIQVAKEKKLYDEPDERKVHKAVIPTLGGLGIFAGFILSTLLGVPKGLSTELQYFVASTVVVFFLGIKDDILVISASKKFIGQIIAAAIIIKFGGVEINNLYGLFGIHEIPPVAATALTFFTVVVITNSFNLIDGVDGLAGSLGVLTTIIFGSYFLYVGEVSYAVMAFAMTGSLIGFLVYNFAPAKIFMGDTGSLLVGLLNAILVIKFINVSETSGVALHINAAPAIGFSILMIPLFDTLRVFSYRFFDGRSPFSPDRNHIHHLLLDLGQSHRSIALLCIGANIIFILIAYSLQDFGTTIVMGVLLLTALAVIGLIYYARLRMNSSKENEKVAEKDIVKSHKILSFSRKPVDVE